MSLNAMLALAALAVLVFWAVGAHNRLIKLRNDMHSHLVQLGAQLQRRHELCTPLTEASLASADIAQAASAAAHQAKSALALVRAHPGEVGPMVSLGLAEHLLDAALGRLVLAHPVGAETGLSGAALSRPLAEAPSAENASEPTGALVHGATHAAPNAATTTGPNTSNTAPAEWNPLIEDLTRIESQIAFARQLFNTAVGGYNHAVTQHPTCWLTGLFRLRPSAPLAPEALAPHTL